MKENNLTTLLSVSIIIVSLLIVFNFVNILQNTQLNHPQITGHVAQKQSTNQTQKEEMYSTQSYLVYYSIITFTVSIIIFLAIILHKTIWRNIELEESQNKLS